MDYIRFIYIHNSLYILLNMKTKKIEKITINDSSKYDKLSTLFQIMMARKINEIIDYLNTDLESKNTSEKELREKIVEIMTSHIYDYIRNAEKIVDLFHSYQNEKVKEIIEECSPKAGLWNGTVEFRYGIDKCWNEFKSNLKEKYGIEI